MVKGKFQIRRPMVVPRIAIVLVGAAGLRAGDVIEQVNRQPIRDSGDFKQGTRKAGKEALVLLVNRCGKRSFISPDLS